jgi:hypothetical protein
MDWLEYNFPNLQRVDVNYSMERYEFPPYVRAFIFANWTKISEENGGTYQIPPRYFENTPVILKNTLLFSNRPAPPAKLRVFPRK